MSAKSTADALCSVDGCYRPRHARGFCGPHYMRWKRHGDPLAEIERHYRFPDNLFLRLQWTPSGCVEFTGSKDAKGYGQVRRDGRAVKAHRASYELIVGPIPDGMQLDHLCRNTSCVNPEHLEPVTNRENQLRGNGQGGLNARKTHCKRGHPFDEQNTHLDRSGKRVCLACRDARNAARYRGATA